jgi:hypothetical protein
MRSAGGFVTHRETSHLGAIKACRCSHGTRKVGDQFGEKSATEPMTSTRIEQPSDHPRMHQLISMATEDAEKIITTVQPKARVAELSFFLGEFCDCLSPSLDIFFGVNCDCRPFPSEELECVFVCRHAGSDLNANARET